MQNLYQFHESSYYGLLLGNFLATPEAVAGLMGKTVHFGEALGKHSEVSVVIDKDNVKLLTDDQDFIAKHAVVFKDRPSGYNPFDYYEPEEEENEC